MVRNTTLTPALSFLSWAIASMPLRCGMVMSATMTSGCSVLAAATNARPSSTTPTSSKSSSSRRLRPSLTTRWSSASSTRGRFTLFSLQGHPGGDHGTVSGAAVDRDLAAEQERSLSHAGKSETDPGAVVRQVETDAIISDRKLQAIADVLQVNFGLGGFGVACDVAQRLLGDAKQTKRGLVRNRSGKALDADVEPHGTASRRTLALRLNRCDKTGVFEDRGMHSIRKGVNVLAQSHQALAHGPHRAAPRRTCRIALFAAGVDRQQRQPLRDVVVQLARQPRAL